MNADDDSRIRITHGGPFYRLMSRTGMRRRALRALSLALLTWCVPILMLLSTGGAYLAGTFLHDWGTWAKFLIAPVLLTLAEKPIAFAIDECASPFLKVPLLSSVSRADGEMAFARARRRTTAVAPEAFCFLVALAASAANCQSFLDGNAPLWAWSQNSLSVAGIWCLAVSNTVYWFLLARLIWKHLVWAGFLADIADCHLRLVVTHPDGHAGLGFLGLYPAGYGLFTLALSSVAAASVGHVMEHESLTPTLFAAVCVAWLIIVILYYALPLLGLAAKVAQIKRKTALLAMAKATDYERGCERLAFGVNIDNDPQDVDLAGLHDVKPIWIASQKTSGFFINKGNIILLLAPALCPLLGVGAVFLPYSQLAPMVTRLLLL